MTLPTGFQQALRRQAEITEEAVDKLLPTRAGDRLRQAMRYAALGGGKRLRPFLVMESARLFNVPQARAIRVAVALECIHCYSLVHDDLPAMDDDALRRGRPTTHIAFDEATAILAGDALLTHAFALIADIETHPDGAVRARLIAALAEAAGDGGMCGGQMRDIEAESAPLDVEGTLAMQAMKTGALFRFACRAGACLAGADQETEQALDDFGGHLGTVFQIADDLLDEQATSSALGKATGKDRERGKATLPALMGHETARARMLGEIDAAIAALDGFGDKAAMLIAAIRFAAERER